MNVPLVDLIAQYRTIEAEVDEAIRSVLESGQFILGPQVSALEQEVAAYLGTAHAVGVGSGTDALVLALRALDVGPGDEVIVPTYTFFATAEAVMLVGATPVLVDIEPATYGIDVDQVRKKISARTKAIIPVHLFGHPANMDALLECAREYGVRILEDNAQAIGAEYRGHKTGSLGDAGCLSFFPSKNLGAYGDAGMVVTNNPEVADRIRMLRTHGCSRKYCPEFVGYNSRLDELQAAILRVKLRHLETWSENRRRLADAYNRAFTGTDIVVPREMPGSRHVYHLYVILVEGRDMVQRFLKARGIAAGIYYPQPVHAIDVCRGYSKAGDDYPVAERCARDGLAIPLYPELTIANAQLIATMVVEAMAAPAVV
jgi:dTDP-4-amino-4,6-dideoxygalactose transaminase